MKHIGNLAGKSLKKSSSWCGDGPFLAHIQAQPADADEGEGRVSQHQHHSEEQAKIAAGIARKFVKL